MAHNSAVTCCPHHTFHDIEEVHTLRASLLKWYAANKRDLPWRRRVLEAAPDSSAKAYAVWVSEIMLQQTQVATVVPYYERWMKKWPTVYDLASADLEEVREMWAGLGYYSRGHRLWEGAKKVVEELKGEFPKSAKELLVLPGVGHYTAGAVASIALNEVCGAVDGNVIRVFSRLRAIGAYSHAKAASDHFWQLAEQLVDRENPGHFNQALMELGATLCTPKSPACSDCPISEHCVALKMEKEKRHLQSKNQCNERCALCLPHGFAATVSTFPMKAKKKEARSEHFVVGVVMWEDKFLITKRPPTALHTAKLSTDVHVSSQWWCSKLTNHYLLIGLLAGMWEFPCVETKSTQVAPGGATKALNSSLSLPMGEIWEYLGTVAHQFSHLHHTYEVYLLNAQKKPADLTTDHKWVDSLELMESAICTSVKKIYQLLTHGNKKRGNSTLSINSPKKQCKLDTYFHKP
ncbi:hypothetical protein EMCRGX_G026230 [Ephydatia muelleri]